MTLTTVQCWDFGGWGLKFVPSMLCITTCTLDRLGIFCCLTLLPWVQIALAVGDDKLRPTIPPDTPRALVSVAGACFEPDPAMRPSFAVIVHHLSKFLAHMQTSPATLDGASGSLRRMFGWGSGGESPSPTKSVTSQDANGHELR